MELNLLYAAITTFILNIPFGFWREGVRKFSFKWFFFIHVPIPGVIFLRHFFDLGFQLYTYPFMLGAFFFGQFSGKFIKRKYAQRIKST